MNWLPLLWFGLGFLTCSVIAWILSRMVEGDGDESTTNPPVCRYCGCAHPLGEQNPASDPGLKT